MSAVINRVNARTSVKVEEMQKGYFSVYEVIEKITTEVVKNNRELVTDITLGKISESALMTIIIKIINKYNFKVLGKSRDELVTEVLDFIFHYGPVQKILDIENCNGVFINGPDNVWAKIGNRMERVNISFGSVQNLTSYIYTIKAKLRGEINENSPLATFEDAENKLRIICCIAPMAHISPTVVFRKHGKEGFGLKDLIEMGMLSEELADDLKRFNDVGANIIICGKGGAGKTTLIRALVDSLCEEERILIMEETAEIFSKHPNAIHIIVKRNENGKIINMLNISETGLKMTMNRYVFGEIREGEAMAFFYGAFSGNTTMTSIHAGSARQAIRKAMIMMKMSGTSLSDDILLDMLYESTNIIIFLDSFVVTEVVEIVKNDKNIIYNDLWRFNIRKRQTTFIEGEHEKVGYIKSQDMIDKLRNRGLLRKEEAEGVAARVHESGSNVFYIPRGISSGDKHRS